MLNVAVILAGGIGTRVGGNIPKQLLPLEDGRSILEHSVQAFEDAENIDEIVVVMHPDYRIEVQTMLLKNGWQKVEQIIAGGQERWESSWNAIKAIEAFHPNEDVNVLLHDAARPYVSQRIIADVIDALQAHKAVSVAIQATDTMYQCIMHNAQCTIKSIPERTIMFRAQTPQAFRLSLIHKAYKIAQLDSNPQVTDDCGIVHQYMPDVPIYVVQGEEQNRKITFKEDIYK